MPARLNIAGRAEAHTIEVRSLVDRTQSHNKRATIPGLAGAQNV